MVPGLGRPDEDELLEDELLEDELLEDDEDELLLDDELLLLLDEDPELGSSPPPQPTAKSTVKSGINFLNVSMEGTLCRYSIIFRGNDRLFLH